MDTVFVAIEQRVGYIIMIEDDGMFIIFETNGPIRFFTFEQIWAE